MILIFKRWFVFIFSFSALALGQSALTHASQTLNEQRKAYSDLKVRIRTASGSQLAGLIDDINALSDYPLFPYLYHDWVSRDIRYAKREQVMAFLDATEGLPIRRQILKRWLRYLAKNRYYTRYLQDYEAGLGTEFLCRQMHHARRKNGTDSAWFQQAEVIWLSGTSQPDACDPVLQHWRQQGYLTPKLAKERLMLAGKAQQKSLTRYLTSYLAEEDVYLGRLWQRVHQNPTYISRPSRVPFKDPASETELVNWALQKMAWRQPTTLANSISRWKKAGTLPRHILDSATQTLAVSKTVSKKDDALPWLEKAASQSDDRNFWWWHAIYYVRKQQWAKVLDVIDQMPTAIRQQSGLQYWYARANEMLSNVAAANDGYAQLASQRHYYGFMAASRMNMPLQIQSATQWQPSEGNNALTDLASNPALLRARELRYHGEHVNARREWYSAYKRLSDGQTLTAMQLAHQWQWHDRAIGAALKAGEANNLTVRFPMAYREQFEKAAQRNDIPLSLAMSIARRESSFMTDAISSANARGLMQILPSTATFLAKQTKQLPSALQTSLRHGNVGNKLFDPQINIETGTAYLHYLFEKMDHNTIAVIASYNAGWRKVRQWLPKQPVPVDIWIDSIPYRETREYVKAVLAYQAIYAHYLGESNDMFAVLPENELALGSAL